MRWLLAALIMMSAVPADAAWQRAESENFIVYSNTDKARLDSFVRRLELFSALMRLRTGVKVDPADAKLKVFAVNGEAAVQRAMGEGSRNVAGFYNANIMGAYAFVPRGSGGSDVFTLGAETVLFHEYAHHFMLQYFPRGYPAWFVEGFAEFYSTTAFNKDGSVSIGMPAMHRAYAIVLDTPFPMRRMLAADPGKMSDDETERFYAWSWVLTHYLVMDEARKGQLDKYLAAFGKGEDPEQAATAAFGDLANLQKDVTRYAAASRITTRKMTGWTPPTAQVDIKPLDAAESDMMPLLMHFVQGSNGKEQVDRFVRDARAAAAQYPDHPMALEMLAEGELDAGDLAAAAKANDALLAQKPADTRALLRRARIAEAQMAKSGYAGGWPAIRKLIAKANHANPNDPFPLMEYYTSYAHEAVPAPKLAVDGLRRALDLAPQVEGLRMALAQRLIADGNRDEARQVLGPVLNDPHSAELRAAARALLDPPPPAAKAGDMKTDKAPSQ